MTLVTGQSPPLHSRFNEKKALDYIRNRYIRLKELTYKQIEVLQDDALVCAGLRDYYGKGYKDWVILSAVFNCMLNWKAEETKRGWRIPKTLEEFKQQNKEALDLQSLIKNFVYPASRFLGSDMENHMKGHALYVLKTYGFELRRQDYKPGVVEQFLRTRMKHYDFDLPHNPLFGDPPGGWPKV